MRRVRTALSIAAILAILGALIWVSFRPVPVPVDLHTVASGPMIVTVDADGETRIREVYEVSAPFTGNARRSPVRVGDPVVANETVVALVDPIAPALLDERSRSQAEASLREAEAALHVAESELRRAEEEWDYAIRNRTRLEELFQRGAITLTRLEDAAQGEVIAEAARDAASSRLQMATGAVDRARAALEPVSLSDTAEEFCCVRLTAPVDGVVLDVRNVSARPVLGGAELVSVGDPRDLEIAADLLSADAVRLGPGARAIVERWGGADPLEAQLRRIEPVARTKVSALGIEEQRVDAVFDLKTPGEVWTNLGHGFSVFLRVVEWESPETLQVPLSALVRNNGNWAVFIVTGDRAELREVEVGRRNQTAAQILGGLEAGEQIVTHPSDGVADGALVVDRAGLD